jgi:hypothetical protein
LSCSDRSQSFDTSRDRFGGLPNRLIFAFKVG